MRRVKGFIVAIGIVVVVSGSAQLRADDADFILAKPEICNHVTWDDWDYWYYGCYAF